MQTPVSSSVSRILLRAAIIALVCSAVTVLTVLKYTSADGLRAPVETVRISPSGIDALSAEEIENGVCPCGNKVIPWYEFFRFDAPGFVLYGYPGADEAQGLASVISVTGGAPEIAPAAAPISAPAPSAEAPGAGLGPPSTTPGTGAGNPFLSPSPGSAPLPSPSPSPSPPPPPPPSPPPPPPPVVNISAVQFIDQTCAALYPANASNGIPPPGAGNMPSPAAAIDIFLCQTLLDVVLQAVDPNPRDHELAAGGTYQGAQLLSERQLTNATQDWLYQQIQSSLTPTVNILRVRELELVYLEAAAESTPGVETVSADAGVNVTAVAELVSNSSIQTELGQVQLMLKHISAFTSGQSNPVYGLITKEVNWHYTNYRGSCAPVYCDITQVKSVLARISEFLGLVGGLWATFSGIGIAAFAICRRYPCVAAQPWNGAVLPTHNGSPAFSTANKHGNGSHAPMTAPVQQQTMWASV